MTLKELLKEKDLHGAQLARRLGRNRATINYWASGKNTPKLKDIHAIADALYVSRLEVIDCFAEPIEIEVKFVNHEIASFKELLDENLITASDLAKKLGLSRQAVSLWVTGATFPNVKDLYKIAKAIGTDVLTLYNSFREHWTNDSE